MSKDKKSFAHPDQYNIFDVLATLQDAAKQPPAKDGAYNVSTELRQTISDSIRASRLSRWEIAGRMSALLDAEVTKYQLDSWTAESKESWRFPAEYLPAFCEAVGSHEPLRLLAEKCDVFVLPGAEALRAEIQKIDEEVKALHVAKRKRLALLGGIDGRTPSE